MYTHMVKLKPTVVSKLGVTNSEIKLDTPEWLEFLGTHATFTYSGYSGNDYFQMNLVKRNGSKWYANKKIYSPKHGKPVPVSLYIGADNQCTKEKLETTLWSFSQDWTKFWNWYYSDERKATLKKGCTPSKTSTPNTQSEEIAKLKTQVKELEKLEEELLNLQTELREARHRCMHLENENNRLTRLGQDYSQATVAKLSQKYTKALNDVQHWKDSSESYQRQAAKLRAELDQLSNTLGNQQSALELLEEYLAQVGGIPLDEKGKPKARYDQLAKFKNWLSERTP